MGIGSYGAHPTAQSPCAPGQPNISLATGDAPGSQVDLEPLGDLMITADEFKDMWDPSQVIIEDRNDGIEVYSHDADLLAKWYEDGTWVAW